MKKIIKIKNLCCANCALKIEREIAKVDGVKEVALNFIMQKAIMEVDEQKWDEIVNSVKKICKKVEPDCEIAL